MTERRINLRFEEAEYRQIAEKAAREDVSFQELGVTWFREWLAGQRGRPPREEFCALTGEEEAVLLGVLAILRDPTIPRDDPGHIKQALLLLGRALLRRTKTPEPPNEP